VGSTEPIVSPAVIRGTGPVTSVPIPACLRARLAVLGDGGCLRGDIDGL
jgi:hypothetical protein